MKTKQVIFAVALSLAGAVVVSMFLNRSPETIVARKVSRETVIGAPSPLAPLEPGVRSESATPDFSVAPAKPKVSSEAAVGYDQAASPVIAEEITVHVSSDFRLGDLSNLVTSDVLRMGDGFGFGPRGAPSDQRFGVYISPEQEAIQNFDEIIAQSEAVIPEGSELVFEFRTRAADGDWSVWQRIEPNQMSQPVPLAAPADAWQYRLSFFAGDPTLSPRVGSIAFATRPSAPR